jgi:hypothetical protein
VAEEGLVVVPGREVVTGYEDHLCADEEVRNYAETDLSGEAEEGAHGLRVRSVCVGSDKAVSLLSGGKLMA